MYQKFKNKQIKGQTLNKEKYKSDLLWSHMSTWAPAVAKRLPSHWWSTALGKISITSELVYKNKNKKKKKAK